VKKHLSWWWLKRLSSPNKIPKLEESSRAEPIVYRCKDDLKLQEMKSFDMFAICRFSLFSPYCIPVPGAKFVLLVPVAGGW
jgi:hypothetical protein